MDHQIDNIAIIGAGTMGLGVAEWFAAAGVRVFLTDATPEWRGRRSGACASACRGM